MSDHDPQVARFSLRPTLESLAALVQHLADGAQVDDVAERALRRRLEKVARLVAKGKDEAAAAQLDAFATHAVDLSPGHITGPAARILAREAPLVLLGH